MPVYEYYWGKCKRDVRVTLSISEHNKAKKVLTKDRHATVRSSRSCASRDAHRAVVAHDTALGETRRRPPP